MFSNTIVLGIFLNHLTSKSDVNTLYFYLGLLAIISLSTEIITNFLYQKSYFYQKFTTQYLFEIVLEKYKSIPIEHRNEPLFSEIERNTNTRRINYFIGNFIRTGGTVYSMFLSFIAITFIDVTLFIIALSVGLVSLYFRSLSELRDFEARDENRYNETILNKKKENFNYTETENFSDNVIINNNFNFLFEKYKKQLEKFFSYNVTYYKSVEKIRDYSGYILGVAGAITLILVYLKGINGEFAIGTLTILVSSYMSFTRNLSRLGQDLVILMGDYLEVKSFNSLLEYSTINTNLIPFKSNKNFEVEFKNISFKYPETDNYVIQNLSFKLKKGDKLGVIGHNGAGKSTLLKLMFKLYKPTEGEILLNGQNIFTISDEEYFSFLKILGQHQEIEQGLSVKELIHLGNTSKKIDEAEIKWAAKMAGVDKIVKEFEYGYDQKLSMGMYLLNKFSKENYKTPSPGQERRIQIARIFYCKKPIIILDEPTSNVDPITSKDVFDNLNKLKNNDILILIAHDVLRLNNTANKILVLESGRMKEFGDREKLIKNENSEYFKILSTFNSKNLKLEN